LVQGRRYGRLWAELSSSMNICVAKHVYKTALAQIKQKGNIRMKVTLRCFSVTTVAVEKQ